MKLSATLVLLITAIAGTYAGNSWRFAGYKYTGGSCDAGKSQVDSLGTMTQPITTDDIKSVNMHVRAQIKEDVGCNSQAYIVEPNECRQLPDGKPIHCIQLLKSQG